MWIPLIILSIISFVLSSVGTGRVLRYLQKHQVMDAPTSRSNHTTPTPRGGGIAIVAVILMGMLSASFAHPYLRPEIYLVMGCAALLAIISWRDDRKPVAALWRFLAQLICVAASLYILFPDGLLFQGLLPPLLDKLIAAFLWLWFINLYNFMDGIDGITGMQTLFICAGLAVVTLLGELPPQTAFHAVLIGSATLGFLKWNWHPAKLFMGDVGSITLGYLLGWLLLGIAYDGQWAAALILPAYYLTDSAITILRRLRKGEKIWQAHSQHCYQQAVRAGRSHDDVVFTIMRCNMVLFVLAIATVIDAGFLLLYAIFALTAVISLLNNLKNKKPEL